MLFIYSIFTNFDLTVLNAIQQLLYPEVFDKLEIFYRNTLTSKVLECFEVYPPPVTDLQVIKLFKGTFGANSLFFFSFFNLILLVFTLTLLRFKVTMESFNLPVTNIGRATTTLNSNNLHKTQKKLEEVIEIVRSDIGRIIEREGRLQNLTARVGNLTFIYLDPEFKCF